MKAVLALIAVALLASSAAAQPAPAPLPAPTPTPSPAPAADAPAEPAPAAEQERPPTRVVPPPPPACDIAAVEADRAALARERRAARRWNTAWAIAYAGFAGLQVGAALAEFSLGGEFDDAARASLYIGAGKAVIGSLARIVLPLRVPPVTQSADPCADIRSMRHAHAVAARKEQRTFWLQLGGGMALHVLGGGYLVVYEDSWKQAITSFALGVVVSGVTLYTEPKTSWRSPRVVPMPTTGGAGLALVGTF